MELARPETIPGLANFCLLANLATYPNSRFSYSLTASAPESANRAAMTATAAREATTVPTGVTIHATKSATNAGGGPACCMRTVAMGRTATKASGRKRTAFVMPKRAMSGRATSHSTRAPTTLTATMATTICQLTPAASEETTGMVGATCANAHKTAVRAQPSAMPASVASANVA